MCKQKTEVLQEDAEEDDIIDEEKGTVIQPQFIFFDPSNPSKTLVNTWSTFVLPKELVTTVWIYLLNSHVKTVTRLPTKCVTSALIYLWINTVTFVVSLEEK